jgi:IMP dehydrogenase
MKILPEVGLTYDDVLLVPQFSTVASRKRLDTRARLTSKIALHIPIVSANMDTVTEYAMAIAMAREGGIGIIHRFMSSEAQCEQIKRVKESDSYVMTDPLTLNTRHTIADARRLLEESGAGSVLIVNGQQQLMGIVTTRDLRFESNPSPITNAMRDDVVTAPIGTSLAQAQEILHEHRIEKLPLVDNAGRLAGLITAAEIGKVFDYPNATRDAQGRLAVGAAIGVKESELRRVECLLEAGADCIVVDIAHGDSQMEVDIIAAIRRRFKDAQIIGGNVATGDGARRLIDAGADAVKVGVGPGSICITRIVAGAGYPQLSAVSECVQAAQPHGVPIIADGGIRYPGDVAKAIAAGASSVMIGSLLAGTDESPGLFTTRKGHRYKVSRGMASAEAAALRKKREDEEWITQEEMDEYVAEGVEAFVPYRGKVKDVLNQLVGGLRSGMSYSGAHSIAEFQEKAIFVRMTGNGLKESLPHDVELM